jgi:hypothetical protein
MAQRAKSNDGRHAWVPFDARPFAPVGYAVKPGAAWAGQLFG